MPRLHHMIAQRFGYTLIPKRKNHLQLEPHVVQVLDHYAADAVIDVGANEGQFATALREHGYAGPILSYEPGERAFAGLRERSSRDPEWHVERTALGANDGERTLFVPDEHVYASLLQMNDAGRAQLGVNGAAVGAPREEKVVVKRLDEAVKTVLPMSARRIYLKIDTQGFDLEVFAGASGLLDRVVGLQVELPMRPLYDGMPDFHEALVEFEGAGFEITGFFPVTRDRRTLGVIEYDAVLVRPSALPPHPGTNGTVQTGDFQTDTLQTDTLQTDTLQTDTLETGPLQTGTPRFDEGRAD